MQFNVIKVVMPNFEPYNQVFPEIIIAIRCHFWSNNKDHILRAEILSGAQQIPDNLGHVSKKATNPDKLSNLLSFNRR